MDEIRGLVVTIIYYKHISIVLTHSGVGDDPVPEAGEFVFAGQPGGAVEPLAEAFVDHVVRAVGALPELGPTLLHPSELAFHALILSYFFIHLTQSVAEVRLYVFQISWFSKPQSSRVEFLRP